MINRETQRAQQIFFYKMTKQNRQKVCKFGHGVQFFKMIMEFFFSLHARVFFFGRIQGGYSNQGTFEPFTPPPPPRNQMGRPLCLQCDEVFMTL